MLNSTPTSSHLERTIRTIGEDLLAANPAPNPYLNPVPGPVSWSDPCVISP